MSVCIYAPLADDFTTNGLGILTPLECTVEEQAAGMYELEMVHPIDSTLRWMQIQNGCIVKVPVPVRENPMYEYTEDIIEGQDVTVTRKIYRANTPRMHLRNKPKSAAKKITPLPYHGEVVLLDYDGVKWAKVTKVKGGQTGYCPFGGLTYVRSKKEVISQGKVVGQRVIELEQSREQLFRIYSVEQDSEAATVTAKAMHVFYDEAGNLINAKYEPSKVALATVMSKITSSLHQTAEVDFHALGLDGKITGDLSYKTPVEAYLDPDEGIVAQTGAILIRDNWDAYLLKDTVRDEGVTIRRGKNLIGVEVTNDISDIVTRIIPIGKKKNGDPLGLSGTAYVDSPHIGEYPFPRTKRVEYDVQTGKDGFNSDSAVRTELKRLAQEDFSVNGVDLPTYGMEVDFVLLQNTAEYANFASLQAVHLYDTVTVIDEMLGLKAKVRVTGYKWDCLTKQYEYVTLGELQDLNQTVYSFNLPTGGVSGSKIMNNSMSGSAMRDASIEYAKITTAAIEQLSATAITALTARIQEIVAQKLTTDELYAAYAEMITLKVGSITASNIQTDALAAELARITVLAAATATFDKATIQHLVAAAMNLEYGVAGQVFIKNLAVEYAQMIGATIGELCIKASDGNYYIMDVNPDGTVTATKTTISSSEAKAGQTSGGKIILETSITAANLNAGNLLATYALINQIDAARIDVDQLFAREAFIDLLRTSKIIGNESISIIAERTSKNFRQEDAPETGIKPGDTWVKPSTGETYQAEDASRYGLKFYLAADGSLQYELAVDDGTVSVSVNGYDLEVEGIVLQEGAVPIRWELVRDSGVLSEEAFRQHYMRLDAEDGLHIGALDENGDATTGEVRIDSDSVDIMMNGKTFSSFAANYVEFGNYQIRKSAKDGGLVFKAR